MNVASLLSLSDDSSTDESKEEDLDSVSWSDHITTYDRWDLDDEWGNSSLVNLSKELTEFFKLLFNF